MLKRTDSGVSSDGCASVDFAQLAYETAKGINNTDLLKLMMTQENVFVHDEKNHFTVVVNETLLSSMKTALDNGSLSGTCPRAMGHESTHVP